MPLDPGRTVAELRELRELTGDENGAQRVAWTPTWVRAKDWVGSKLEDLPLEYEVDQAGNQWWTLRGASPQAVLLGGHIDSVPNGGWLDGCLNVVAAAEVLRRIAEEGTPPVTIRLVNWADEEGARFGRSLFGSSAAAGSMADQDELRQLADRDGISLPDAVREHGVDLDTALEARSQLESAAAYLELHIEQGPVLESLGLPLGAVLGTFGVERHRITWRGQAAHAGSTPMDQRRDALAGAAKLALELRVIAARVGDGAVLTSGGVVCRPGIVTSVVETAEQLLDLRHLDAAKLAAMWEQVREACERFAEEENLRRRVRADLGDRADPLRRDVDRLCRRGHPGGRRTVAPASERASARRRRGIARGRAHRDDLRPEPPRPLPHEARGHEAGAPRAGRPGARPAGDEDDRLDRGRLTGAPAPPDAVVFDCDGLLLETEDCWTLAEAELFERYGRTFGDDEKRTLIGTSLVDGSRILERLLDQPGRADALGAELLMLVERRLLEEAAAFPGAEELVLEVKARVPVAVASNTPERLVRGALACAGLAEHFEVVVTADQVAEPKPSPDVYLRACELLGARPAASIALEDSPTGVAAARAAGMFVIGVPSFPDVRLDAADLVGRSLADGAVRSALGL